MDDRFADVRRWLVMARNYTQIELAALSVACRHAWSNCGDPTERGPAQFAAGPYWPKELRRRAALMRSQATAFEVAAAALEREIEADPRCR